MKFSVPSYGQRVVSSHSMGQNTEMSKEQRISPAGVIWDLPLRVFHWGLVASVMVSFASIKNGNMFIHEKSGLTILGLLGFRLVWGIVGHPHARFARFLSTPVMLVQYIRARLGGDRHYHRGHAPTGGYATVVILLSLLTMAVLGTMSNNDILYEGPLAAWAGDFTKTASVWHHRLERLMIALVVLHLLAMAVYRFVFGHKLIPPMITGGHDPEMPVMGKWHQIGGLGLLVGSVLLTQYLGYDSTRFY